MHGLRVMPYDPRSYAAKRNLFFSEKGHSNRHRFTVFVHLPEEVQPASVSFDVSPGTACCLVEFGGLEEPNYEAYGADALQALALATDIDPILRGLSKKYDFFYETGEPYFDDV